MCTVLVRLDPDGAWPVLAAFVRDEDRDRPTEAPGRWWPSQPDAIGGMDGIAGGTWLALDPSARALAMLTDQFDPDATIPDPALSPTRGTLPLLVLERGGHFDLEADAPGGVAVYQPFHLMTLGILGDGMHAERWGWDGSALEHEDLTPGDHVIASRARTLPGEDARRRRLLASLGDLAAVDPDPSRSTAEAWGDWLDLLDGRDVAPDDLDQLTICSVTARPGFGTVGASLVGLAADGRVRYDVNRTAVVAPDRWMHVTT